jgi:hypothetical protein
MNNIDNLQFHIGPFGDNRWLALSFQSPYLCFEAESKKGLLEKCKRALVFCRKCQARIELNRDRKILTFQATEVVSAKELEDA